MGIRINKALGYGITGLSVDPENKYITNDPRINTKALWVHDEDDDENEGQTRRDLSDDAYLAHVEQFSKAAHKKYGEEGFSAKDEFIYDMAFEYSMLKHTLEDPKRNRWTDRFTNGVVYNGEYADPGTLLIIPPGMIPEWTHHDDMIDYIEATLDHTENGKKLSSSVRMSTIPLFPYDSWMDIRTGQRVVREKSDEALVLRRLSEANMSNLTDEEKQEYSDFLEKSAQKFGYESYHHFKEVIVPLIPSQVKDFTDWLGIFTHDKVWLELRPMVYTYWA